MEKQIPIAIHKDLMDGEGPGTTLTFRPARYPIGGGDANDFGSWYQDNGDSAVGNSHWRMSLPGGNTYPSSAFDRLVHSYKNPSNNCNSDALDAGLTNIEQILGLPKIIPLSRIHFNPSPLTGLGDHGSRRCGLS